MKIINVKSDVFALLELPEIQGFAHGVNCHGKMGAGVAKDVRQKWPAMFSRYRELCKEGKLAGGKVWAWADPETGKIVFNLASQELPGPRAKLEWVVESVAKMAEYCEKNGIANVAAVRIGCGIGGLSWEEVEPALREIRSEVTLHVAFL